MGQSGSQVRWGPCLQLEQLHCSANGTFLKRFTTVTARRLMPCFVNIDFLQSTQLRSYPAHACYVEKISFIQRNLYFSTLFLSVVAGCKFWWAQTTITTRDKVFLGKGNP